MSAAGLLADETGLEQELGATETLAVHSDNVSIRELVRFLFVRAFGGLLHLSVEVKCNVSQLLLYFPHVFTFCRGGERVAAASAETAKEDRQRGAIR